MRSWILLHCRGIDRVLRQLRGVCQGFYLFVSLQELQQSKDHVLVHIPYRARYCFLDQTSDVFSRFVICDEEKPEELFDKLQVMSVLNTHSNTLLTVRKK